MELKLFESYKQDGADKTFSQTVAFHPDSEGVENEVINLYPEITYETFEGFGGAITDSAGYIYSLMSEEDKKKVIHKYFSADEMKYRIVRIHMDSCDFSIEQYEAMSDPTDVDLDSFSFERTEKYIMPLLEDANREANGELRLMLSPWSPPAFMKTNGERSRGGKLKDEYKGLWAKYICRYIEEFKKRGYFVERISLQNEPKAVQPWDSCIYTAQDEKEFLRDYLAPEMKKCGYDDIEVFIWDHNKERIYERVRDTVDENTKDLITGAAFHWYSGDHFDALRLVKERYPDLKLILSESCLEYSKFDADHIEESIGCLTHEIMGDLNAGMCAFYDWNILLDEQGGPNHVGNFCHAPFLYDTKNNKLLPQDTLVQFHHFAHFIEAGSKRIAFSKYTKDIEAAAYVREDGAYVLVLTNNSSEAVPVNVRVNDQAAEIMLQKNAMASCIIE